MAYLSFVPLVTFAVIALSVALICACGAFSERRRQRFHARRPRGVFRPVIIQGGKAGNALSGTDFSDALKREERHMTVQVSP